MQTEKLTIAHSLYVLYETLSDDIQQAFLQKLFQKQRDKLENLAFYLACRQTKDENEFLSDTDSQDFIESLPQ